MIDNGTKRFKFFIKIRLDWKPKLPWFDHDWKKLCSLLGVEWFINFEDVLQSFMIVVFVLWSKPNHTPIKFKSLIKKSNLDNAHIFSLFKEFCNYSYIHIPNAHIHHVIQEDGCCFKTTTTLILEALRHVSRNLVGHGSCEFLNFHWLRMSWVPTLGLHEGGFGSHPTIF